MPIAPELLKPDKLDRIYIISGHKSFERTGFKTKKFSKKMYVNTNQMTPYLSKLDQL